MEEACSFVAPGHVPTRWHRPPPSHPHNNRGFHHTQPNQRNAQSYQGHQNNTWAYQNNGQGYPNTPQPYHYNTQSYKNKAQAYQQETYSCGPCNRTFHSKYQLEKHLQEHVKCPFPECHMTAHPKAIERHIDNQHLLVNFANLQIDDEAWIAERKRKFPTSQRAELRRAQQLEKTKRGERLGKSARPFATRGARGRGRGRAGGGGSRGRGGGGRGRGGRGEGDNSDGVKNEQKRPGDSEWSDQRGGKKRRMMDDGRKDKVQRENEGGERNLKALPSDSLKKAPQRQRSGMAPTITVPDPDSEDEEARDGIPAFRGTRHFYESTGEISYFGIKSGTAPECHMKEEEEEMKETNQTEVAISDEEDWDENGLKETSVSAPVVQPTTLALGGALGSLMGAYSDSEGDDDPPESTTLQAGKQGGTQHQTQNMSTKDHLSHSKQEVEHDKTKNESSERSETAAVKPTTTITAATPAPATTKTPRHWKKKRKPKNGLHKGLKPPGGVRSSFPKRRKTLLERLLLPDITRERNIILQCIRFIVQNNFFQIQSNEKGKEKEESGTEKAEEEQRGESMKRKVEEEKILGERSEDMEVQSEGEKEGDGEGKEKSEVDCEKQEKEDDKERKETEEEKVNKSIRNKEAVIEEMICEEDKQGDGEGEEKKEVDGEKQEKEDDKERKETEEEKIDKSIRNKEAVVEEMCEEDKQGDGAGKEKKEVDGEKQDKEDDKETKETEEEKVDKSIRNKDEGMVEEVTCEEDKHEQEKAGNEDRTEEEREKEKEHVL